MENRMIDRREALKAIGGLGLIAAGFTSCGDGPTSTNAPTVISNETNPLGELEIDARNTLINEVSALPDSYIKTLLGQRVVPYFQQATPFVSNTEGFPLPVHASSVSLTYINNKDVKGTYNSRGGNAPSEFRLTSPITIPVPLASTIPEDQGYKFPVEFRVDEPVYEGVAPKITVKTPTQKIIFPNEKLLFDAVTRSVFIKEASSFLIENMLMADINARMKTANLPTALNAREVSSGREKMVNIVPQIINKIHGRNGRWVNGIDACGILISLKAMNSSDLSLLKNYSTYRPIIDSLDQIDLGNNPSDFINNAMKWYLNYPDISKLPIVGNRNLIP
ncbi:MAG: hypothetical protein Q7T54_03360 [Candidatus Levybacteria bacterium]|nr:hypothetical protein [Candidatus Levybacteria bacterium]